MALQKTLKKWNRNARIQDLVEYGGRRNKHPSNTVTCKLMINKQLCWCFYDIFPTENYQEVIINCFVLCPPTTALSYAHQLLCLMPTNCFVLCPPPIALSYAHHQMLCLMPTTNCFVVCPPPIALFYAHHQLLCVMPTTNCFVLCPPPIALSYAHHQLQMNCPGREPESQTWQTRDSLCDGG
jgi:hypothetical protein